ncbi:MAG: hypothetical protein AAF629_13540 [Chloroflexota bacterium]
MITWQIIIFAYTLWLGFYLIARNFKNPKLTLTGLGLSAYALALGLTLLNTLIEGDSSNGFWTQIQPPILLLPALCWSGVAVHLLSEEHPFRQKLIHHWTRTFVPLTITLYLLHISLIGLNGDTAITAIVNALIIGLILLTLVSSFGLLLYNLQKTKPQRLGMMLALVTLLFGLGIILALFPIVPWLTKSTAQLGIGGDLILLGLCIAVLDAFDEGEALLPDLIRSFGTTLLAVLMFTGPIILVITLNVGSTFSMITLVLATISIAVFRQTFAAYIEAWLDKLAFTSFPHLQQARAELRTASNTLPKIKQSFDPDEISEAEFARLTRKALSHYGDMARLASSPLTQLPLIDLKLTERGVADDTLERAAELKSVLTDSIDRLKPRDKGEFGTTDEWRYYNALYFPYVQGLKPYSRRAVYDSLDPITKQALSWFQTQVPERTLYNWQNTAAKLVAQDLREQQI